MKILIAQTKPTKGNIESNIEQHLRLIDLAIAENVNAIFFPELSITGYEPTLAEQLAIDREDNRLAIFQQISDTKNVIIGIGVPLKSTKGLCISMLIFQPQQICQTYSKQYLHSDELPFFVNGENTFNLIENIALAICYEISIPAHVENAHKMGAKIYIASVAKSVSGMAKAYERLSEIAKTFKMTVLMSNCVGYCDDFECGGKSSIWNSEGILVAQLGDSEEGILVFDDK